MSKTLLLSAELAENTETGKRRILTHVVKDDTLQIDFVMTADEAENWAKQLLELSQTARGKSIIIPS